MNPCLNLVPSSSCLNARSPSLVQLKKNSRSGSCNVKMSMSATKDLSRRYRRSEGGDGGASSKIDHEKMEKWMPEAVVEIVKNLKQAPLLMQVYDSGLKTEKAVAEKWPMVKESWSEVEAPEGVILVEEIADEEEDEATKAWGIVIQGRGCEYGPSCYLLKTSRVRSGVVGSSAGCTHFCLTKVTSFRDTALSQLTNCWLLQ